MSNLFHFTLANYRMACGGRRVSSSPPTRHRNCQRGRAATATRWCTVLSAVIHRGSCPHLKEDAVEDLGDYRVAVELRPGIPGLRVGPGTTEYPALTNDFAAIVCDLGAEVHFYGSCRS